MVIDKESPPGAWADEMKRAPWAFGQRREISVYEILEKMRAHGLIVEADIIAKLLASNRK